MKKIIQYIAILLVLLVNTSCVTSLYERLGTNVNRHYVFNITSSSESLEIALVFKNCFTQDTVIISKENPYKFENWLNERVEEGIWRENFLKAMCLEGTNPEMAQIAWYDYSPESGIAANPRKVWYASDRKEKGNLFNCNDPWLFSAPHEMVDISVGGLEFYQYAWISTLDVTTIEW